MNGTGKWRIQNKIIKNVSIIIKKKQVWGQTASLAIIYKENQFYSFRGLSVHLVFVQLDYNKTELPAERPALEITNHTPRETRGVTEDYDSLWNDKSADMSLCLSSHMLLSWQSESQTWGRSGVWLEQVQRSPKSALHITPE